MELGTQMEEFSPITTHQQLQTPIGRDVSCIPNRMKDTLLLWQGEERFFPYPETGQPMKDCHNSVNKKVTII